MRALATSALVILCSGCPSTEATQVLIEGVKTIGAPDPPFFELSVSGHGFGLLPLTYDVMEGAGAAQEGQVRVEVVRQNGTPAAEIQHITTNIASTTEIRAKIDLSAPLPAGIYSLRLFNVRESKVLVEKPNAFEVGIRHDVIDAGSTTPDAGADGDADSIDLGMTSVDGGIGGPFDSGTLEVADAGLGSFAASFRYRRPLILQNPTPVIAPQGTSFRLLIPHATLVGAGHASPNGSDFALYFQGQRLPHQWEDPVLLGTDQLVMVATLPVDLPQGSLGTPVVLYYGDPAALDQTTDAVYAFTERFDRDLDGNAWRLSEWARSCPDRRGLGSLGSYCRRDDDAQNPLFRTLGSPDIPLLVGQAYELTVWISGLSVDNDLTYFAVSDANDSPGIARAESPPPTAYGEFPPSTMATYQDPTTNSNRTFTGWRFPPAGLGFTRARVRFAPQVVGVNLHFRYISPAGAHPSAYVAVDDLAIRRVLGTGALEELSAGLGAEESR